MDVTIVIDAGWGDGGKGLLVDWKVSQISAPVFRWGSSAQCGHTVTLPDGTRHAHGHLTSGSFEESPGLFGPKFVVHPRAFWEEVDEFPLIRPRISIHEDCEITTPWDMTINQRIEERRGQKRHGSCGYGFGETVYRNLWGPRLRMGDDLTVTVSKMKALASEWFPHRLKQLGLPPGDPSAGRILHFVEQLASMKEDNKIQVMRSTAMAAQLQNYGDLILEGHQGLSLTRTNNLDFPFITRSDTGLTDALAALREFVANIEHVEVIYVTRCYSTRHGAGPFPGDTTPIYKGIVDETNIVNSWQGALRFAPLQIPRLIQNMKLDLDALFGWTTPWTTSLAITCLDQLDEPDVMMADIPNRHGVVSKNTLATLDDVVDSFKRAIPFRNVYLSRGPTRDTVSTYGATGQTR
tara:strand:- start:7628 stop:8851 length:1224 start_codon:yes stop_codon:yes gene_type:complete